MVNVMHTGIEEGKSSLGAEHVVNEDASRMCNGDAGEGFVLFTNSGWGKYHP